MPRPLRIEYENAYYHVMNRGAGRKNIFHGNDYYHAFLECLAEASDRFDLKIHAYCLMSNHYHLLVQTPNANLGRVMRHINGVYTQRHNRLKNTDGPLFRGRYKAILIDADAYLLPLSRYIHRNPIETKQPLVKQLEEFPWSSYPAYINASVTPDWLSQDMVYDILGKKQRYAGYCAFVEQGVDDEILTMYNRNNYPSVIGSDKFKHWLYEDKLLAFETEDRVAKIKPNVTMKDVIAQVAKVYKQPEEELRRVTRGRIEGLESRKIAMYLCQRIAGAKLDEIANSFGLTHRGSVSFVLHQIKKTITQDKKIRKRIALISQYLLKQNI